MEIKIHRLERQEAVGALEVRQLMFGANGRDLGAQLPNGRAFVLARMTNVAVSAARDCPEFGWILSEAGGVLLNFPDGYMFHYWTVTP